MEDTQVALLVSPNEGRIPEVPPFSMRKFIRFAGPGLLMCIAYIDPGNLESDLQTGATTGFALLWLLAVTMCMGYVVQMQAAKLGVATGRHLAELCRAQYPRPAALMLWIMAEVAIIGSDVQEVIGCAIALKLLSGGAVPLWVGCIVAAVGSFFLLLTENAGVRCLEAVFAVMIAAMVAAFGFMFSRAHVQTSDVMRGFLVPQLPRRDIPTAVALFGSLIMPHNIYLHSALVQTRGLQGASNAVKVDALRYFKLESALSLGVVCAINLWVVSVFAAGFYNPAADPPDIGLQNAGDFLGKTYGGAVVIVWSLGLLAAGQSSTMTGTYTGQFVMQGFLNLQVSPWARIIVTRCFALVPTIAVALLMDPASTELDKLNQALNLLQSVQLPFALIPVLTFTGSTRLMGKRLANSWGTAILCWGIAVIVIGVNMAAVAEVAAQWTEATASAPVMRTVLTASLVAVVAGYCLFLLYLLACGPRSRLASAARSLLRAASECPHSTDSEEEEEGPGAGEMGLPGIGAGAAAPGAENGVDTLRVPLLIKEVMTLEKKASQELGPSPPGEGWLGSSLGERLWKALHHTNGGGIAAHPHDHIPHDHNHAHEHGPEAHVHSHGHLHAVRQGAHDATSQLPAAQHTHTLPAAGAHVVAHEATQGGVHTVQVHGFDAASGNHTSSSQAQGSEAPAAGSAGGMAGVVPGAAVSPFRSVQAASEAASATPGQGSGTAGES